MGNAINDIKSQAFILFAYTSDCFHYVKGKMAIPMSPLQKSVNYVATMAVNGFNSLYHSYSHCSKSKKIVMRQKMFLALVDDPYFIKENQTSFNLEKKFEEKSSPNQSLEAENYSIPPTLPTLPKRKLNKWETHLPEVKKSAPKIKKTLLEKLENNRICAQNQQLQEKEDKGFAVNTKPVPNKVMAKLPNRRVRHRVLYGGTQAVNGRDVGFAFCQGAREKMQDTLIGVHQSFIIKNEEHAFELLGVFDGHGTAGDIAAAYVKQNVTQYLKEALEVNNEESLTDQGISDALKECCQNLEADYAGPDGTTALMAVILNGKVWIANVGDSRAIFVKDGTATQASEDAKPEIPRYKKTVEKLGGCVRRRLGEGEVDRVNGVLAVARAIGDKEIVGRDGKTCCISPDPKISYYSLEEFKNGYLVLACDGLYDVATTNEVGRAITQMDELGETVEIMSKRLVHSAIYKGSQDNVSVIITKL